MSKPLVSAIIPTYNRPNKLEQAIQSAVGQSYENIEIVIIDDGSSDDYARDVVDELDTSRDINVCHHEENQGLPATRNTGIQVSNGDYIAFLDDDDFWKPQKIEQQINIMSREDRDVCYTWIQRVNEHGTIKGESTITKSGMVRKAIPEGGFPGPPAFCISTDAAQDIGGFDESLIRGEEVDFAIRLADKYEFSCVPEVLVLAAVSGTPTIEYVREKKMGHQQLLDKHTPFPARFGPNATKRFRARLNSTLGLSALKAGEYGIARRSLAKSLIEDPSNSKTLIYLLAASLGKVSHKPALLFKRLFES